MSHVLRLMLVCQHGKSVKEGGEAKVRNKDLPVSGAPDNKLPNTHSIDLPSSWLGELIGERERCCNETI